MMKKTVLWSLLGLFVSVFSACSSDDNNEPTPNPSKQTAQLVTYQLDDQHRTITLDEIKYDAEGRITKLVTSVKYKSGGGDFTIERNYTYRKDSVFAVTNNGGYTKHFGAKLDEQGKIVSAKDEEGEYRFTYSNGNQLTYIYETSYGSEYESTLTWQNGNIISANVNNEKKDYTYTDYSASDVVKLEETSMALPDIYMLDPVLFKQGFYGAYPKNLIKTYTRKEYITENGEYKQVERTYTLTYTLGSNNKITKITNEQGLTETYTWK